MNYCQGRLSRSPLFSCHLASALLTPLFFVPIMVGSEANCSANWHLMIIVLPRLDRRKTNHFLVLVQS